MRHKKIELNPLLA